jgi:hypothetical protein
MFMNSFAEDKRREQLSCIGLLLGCSGFFRKATMLPAID